VFAFSAAAVAGRTVGGVDFGAGTARHGYRTLKPPGGGSPRPRPD
jgi:hypothetical protein